MARKHKYKSRAARCGEACGGLNSAAEELHGIANDINKEIDDYLAEYEGKNHEPENLDESTTSEVRRIMERASTQFGEMESMKGELEGLAEEMESWRDNMSGTNLEATDKFSRVEEAVDGLQDAISSLDSVSEPSSPPEDEKTLKIETVREYADEIEQAADDIESASGDAEGVDFPGMFG